MISLLFLDIKEKTEQKNKGITANAENVDILFVKNGIKKMKVIALLKKRNGKKKIKNMLLNIKNVTKKKMQIK
jgi:hypothetical protein